MSQILKHFLTSSMQSLLELKTIKADGKFHAFDGVNNATTGYYQVATSNQEGSFTIDYFNGKYEGVATITFNLRNMEVSSCH
ncbi:hypothetical protein [Marinomonas sp. GJ51-6]|uniref:hypothetical protein n=1 Tax=Marinomonas sp. GJ51-6 TaxID=2992802 RepID=UPI002934DFE9|nr:hypothetical protein [Marinomonas sp. GJ51-6]WOD08098.1 hypothetical protein ONZ50_02760 [Marinomonas sp. GJ51-6]